MQNKDTHTHTPPPHTHTPQHLFNYKHMRTVLSPLDLLTNLVVVAELLTQWSDNMARNKPRESWTTSMLQKLVGRQRQQQWYCIVFMIDYFDLYGIILCCVVLCYVV